MLDIKGGSGRRIIKSLCATLYYIQGMMPYCYYDSNVAMARGVCALESSCYESNHTHELMMCKRDAKLMILMSAYYVKLYSHALDHSCNKY